MDALIFDRRGLGALLYGAMTVPPPIFDAVSQGRVRYGGRAARPEMIATGFTTWAEAQPRLRPRLLAGLPPATAARLVQRPFVGDLILTYALDLGDKDLFVTIERFSEWRVTRDAVDSSAIANLEAMSEGLERDPRFEEKGAIMNVSIGDGYDASRIVLPGLRKRLLTMLGTPFHASIPARDLFICWSRGDAAFEARMSRLARENAATMHHALSPSVYAIDEHGVRLD